MVISILPLMTFIPSWQAKDLQGEKIEGGESISATDTRHRDGFNKMVFDYISVKEA